MRLGPQRCEPTECAAHHMVTRRQNAKTVTPKIGLHFIAHYPSVQVIFCRLAKRSNISTESASATPQVRHRRRKTIPSVHRAHRQPTVDFAFPDRLPPFLPHNPDAVAELPVVIAEVLRPSTPDPENAKQGVSDIQYLAPILFFCDAGDVPPETSWAPQRTRCMIKAAVLDGIVWVWHCECCQWSMVCGKCKTSPPRAVALVA